MAVTWQARVPGWVRRSRKRLLAGALTLAAMAPSLWVPPTAQAASVVPTQWISKIYTEALGRLPDQTAWSNMESYFQTNGCSASTLSTEGQPLFNSSEYTGLGYTNAAKLLTLYRGALNREPDSSGYNYNLNALNGGTSWATMVNQFFTSSEFNTLASTICGSNPDYGWGTTPVMAIPTSSSGFTGTESQLQSQLNATASGGTVALAQSALVTLGSTLVIPSGVTLTTTGSPSHNKYALMGRLVRSSNFSSQAVELKPGAKLTYVWVDGQRDSGTNYNSSSINIQIDGGSGTTVSNDRIGNTAGWTNLHAEGTYEGYPCASNTITNNLVDAYTSLHSNNQWSDGLSVACENATVENNSVVDATDVGIVLFRASPAVQASKVSNNTILSAGNSAFGGIVADPLTGGASNPSFSGSSIDHNTLWTGQYTYFHLGLSVGTRAWFGTNANTATGASFSYNTTGTQTAEVTSGIAVSGMLNAYVQNNTLSVILGQHGACPMEKVGASVSAGYASGSIQPYTDVLYSACIN